MTQVESEGARKLPAAGYRLVKVSAFEQTYKVVPPAEVAEPGENEREITFHWDWRLVEGDDPNLFDVRLALTVGGEPAKPESIIVDLVGRFIRTGEPSMKLESFVQNAAPAVLLPYVRERISSLTTHGAFGTYELPMINVLRLVQDLDFSMTTGAGQLSERTEAEEETVSSRKGEEE